MSQLFRQQAIEQQTNRLHGEILLLPQFSHRVLISLLVAWLLICVIWLTNSTYARKETVTGWLAPPSGVIKIYPEDTGIIKQILVKNGDEVVKDQPLIIVNGDRVLEGGQHLETQLLKEYQNQKKFLNEQLLRTNNIYLSRKGDIEQRLQSSQQTLTIVEQQLGTITKRIELMQGRVSRYDTLKQKNMISAESLEQTQFQELDNVNDKQQLLRTKIQQQNLAQQLQTELNLLPHENANNIDQLRSRLSDLAQRIAQLHGQRAHIIKATRNGIINNLQAREGQRMQAGTPLPLMTIMPLNSALTAHLLVPVRSAGFIDIGQPLDIRYDAFPYQKFGIYSGQLSNISTTILLPNEIMDLPIAIQEPMYQVKATLTQPQVQAYGKTFSLKPGMTLSADVRLSERSLLQWLLEPLYSLKGRI